MFALSLAGSLHVLPVHGDLHCSCRPFSRFECLERRPPVTPKCTIIIVPFLRFLDLPISQEPVPTLYHPKSLQKYLARFLPNQNSRLGTMFIDQLTTSVKCQHITLGHPVSQVSACGVQQSLLKKTFSFYQRFR